jgi:hypothetical protein
MMKIDVFSSFRIALINFGHFLESVHILSENAHGSLLKVFMEWVVGLVHQAYVPYVVVARAFGRLLSKWLETLEMTYYSFL